MLPLSSPAHKQKALQQYQLYMQEANKRIYFTTNSLIERFWIGQISIRKGQQNSPVEPLKSNLMWLGWGGAAWLEDAFGWAQTQDMCWHIDRMTCCCCCCCCSQNMTLRENCQSWTLRIRDKIGVWYNGIWANGTSICIWQREHCLSIKDSEMLLMVGI